MKMSDLDSPSVGKKHSKLLIPIVRTTRSFYPFVGVLLLLMFWGAYAYAFQLRNGLAVTGLNNSVFWGVYIVNFVFFIGVAHVGALVSAILRLMKVPWSKPVTRMAEVVTLAALPVAALMPLIDLGRVDRLHFVFLFGRLQSPIVWDFIAISTYVVGSMLFLYIPLIPDIKVVRESPLMKSRVKKLLYRILSAGWKGSAGQWTRLRKGIFALAVIILPIVFMVHTVVSYIFAMQLVPGWNSSIFGPYFVLGAVMSGVATLIIVMWFARRLYHWEDYLQNVHFKGLAIMLLVMVLGYMYFTMNDYVGVAYLGELAERGLLSTIFLQEYSPWFALQLVLLLAASMILILPRTRTINGTFVAAMMVFVSAWVKRFVIIVPPLLNPRIPRELVIYTPSWAEWAITFGAFASFILILTVFAKLFPIVSIWEVEEGEREAEKERPSVPQPLMGGPRE